MLGKIRTFNAIGFPNLGKVDCGVRAKSFVGKIIFGIQNQRLPMILPHNDFAKILFQSLDIPVASAQRRERIEKQKRARSI